MHRSNVHVTRSLKALDRYDDAIADLSQSIKLDPNLSAAYTHRGYCYRKLANFERSVNDYSAAVRLQPSSIRALNNR
jgi:tetratricopeptide (TPR) repeat protein